MKGEGGLPSKSPALLGLTMEVLELAGNVVQAYWKKRTKTSQICHES